MGASGNSIRTNRRTESALGAMSEEGALSAHVNGVHFALGEQLDAGKLAEAGLSRIGAFKASLAAPIELIPGLKRSRSKGTIHDFAVYSAKPAGIRLGPGPFDFDPRRAADRKFRVALAYHVGDRARRARLLLISVGYLSSRGSWTDTPWERVEEFANSCLQNGFSEHTQKGKKQRLFQHGSVQAIVSTDPFERRAALALNPRSLKEQEGRDAKVKGDSTNRPAQTRLQSSRTSRLSSYPEFSPRLLLSWLLGCTVFALGFGGLDVPVLSFGAGFVVYAAIRGEFSLVNLLRFFVMSPFGAASLYAAFEGFRSGHFLLGSLVLLIGGGISYALHLVGPD